MIHDETGRVAEERRKAALPYLERLVAMQAERNRAVAAADLMVDVDDNAYYHQLHRAVTLTRKCLIARRDYDEALAYGRPLTRRERRAEIRKGR
jgi:hypothetical protein